MMRIFFKRALFLMLMPVILSSCNEWITTESVRFDYETLENKNPDIYREYCNRLKAYKSSDHALMIAKFDNRPEAPVGESQHITSLPDSVDYVILKQPGNLSDSIIREMDVIRDEKATKTLYEISLPEIQSRYKAFLEQWALDHLEEDPTGSESPEEFVPFMKKMVSERISLFKEYGYDGINIVFNGVNPESLTEETRVGQETLQDAFFAPLLEWRKDNPAAVLFFEGTPQYVLSDNNRPLVEESDAIIVQTQAVAGYASFDYQISLVMQLGNVPMDRFVVLVCPQSLTDPTLPDGKFSSPDENGNVKTTIIGAAEWTARPSTGFKKTGVCVDDAQNDYFNLQQDYLNIRRAVNIMNPSF